MRTIYMHRLQGARTDVQQLGDAVRESLSRAVRCLDTRNSTVALWVIDNDTRIDEARRTLEERVASLLATQQPIVARDLRLLMSIAAIATDLERIGDYANGIARHVYRSSDAIGQVVLPAVLQELATHAQAMLELCLTAFIDEDEERARSLEALEQTADELRDVAREDVLALAQSDTHVLSTVAMLLDIIGSLERTADRTTNIAERVIYLITGVYEELNEDALPSVTESNSPPAKT